MKKLITLLLALTLLFALAACKKAAGDGLVDGKTIEGCLEMSDAESAFVTSWFDENPDGNANDSFPENFEMKHYSSVTQMLLELDAGRVSMIDLPLCTAQYICAGNSEYSFVASDGREYFKMAVTEENGELRERLSAALAELKADGTLDSLKAEYIENVTAEPAKNELTHIDGAETVKVGVTGDFPPFDYIAADGTPAGFNTALLSALSEKMNVNFELVPIEAAARTTALASGSIDAVFWMMVYGDESAEAYPESGLLFTESYFESVDTVVTKDFPIESVKKMFGLS